MTIILILAFLGFCISLYTFIIEQKVKKNPFYQPFCNISESISCTKPMRSPYANLFFVSNALISMAFYLLIGILAYTGNVKLLALASILGCIVTSVFAYLLYFKVKTLCLLCTALYVINVMLLILSIKHLYY